MNHLLIASGIFACVCGSALSGMYLRILLPEHHLNDESRNAIKLAIGLIARALRVADDVFAARSLALLQRAGSLPLPLLIVLVCWLSIIFGTFGLLAPRNGTIVVAYLLCAFCAAGAIFLILEMDTPLDGIVKVPIGPMRDALAQLDK